MPREELKSKLNLVPHTFNLILQKMVSERIITEGPNWVALQQHKVSFSPSQLVKIDYLMGLFAATPVTPPSVKECLAEVGDDVFSAMREAGELVTVSDEVVFRKTDYESMVDQLRQTLLQKGKITLAEARDLLKTTRKYVQPLLEHLDNLGMTVRVGDYRCLKN
jgi:selenocysteine-specific elongation factor